MSLLWSRSRLFYSYSFNDFKSDSMNYTLKISQRRLLSDTLTPVNIYLKLRDQFAGTILLESSDYHGHENCLSLICCDPIASFQVFNETIDVRYPDGSVQKNAIKNRTD